MPSDATAPERGAFHGKKSLVVMYGVMALVFGALALVSFLNPGTGNSFALLPAVMGVWLAIWMSSTPIVRVERDHVSWKGAPLAPRRSVLFAEIQALEQPSAKKVFLVADLGGKPKRYRLPLNLLSDADGAELVRILKAQAPKA